MDAADGGSTRLGKGLAIGFGSAIVLLSIGIGIAARRKHAHKAEGPAHEASALTVSPRGVCVTLKDETTKCWGSAEPHTPSCAKDASARPVKQVACGAAHRCVLLLSGDVECTGQNDRGQLGDPVPGVHAIPVRVPTEPARAIAAGGSTSCAIAEIDSMIRCWGGNDQGQLVNGGREDTWRPQVIGGVFGVEEIGVGDGFVCARVEDGAVWCWGRNDVGQLGDGSLEGRAVPVRVRL